MNIRGVESVTIENPNTSESVTIDRAGAQRIQENIRKIKLEQAMRKEQAVKDATVFGPVSMTIDATPAQLPLDGWLWDRYEVPSVKVSIRGGVELTVDEYGAIASDLEPGESFVATVAGRVVDVSSPYGPKGHTGRVILAVSSVNAVQVVSPDE